MTACRESLEHWLHFLSFLESSRPLLRKFAVAPSFSSRATTRSLSPSPPPSPINRTTQSTPPRESGMRYTLSSGIIVYLSTTSLLANIENSTSRRVSVPISQAIRPAPSRDRYLPTT
ncbi:hypothetical protein LZ32DRAFT_304197 [Colletotrichum eremochloae]|nr:hypothetical protein LZ32DRAFT_304197 [Colletotrichum eremochloae]